MGIAVGQHDERIGPIERVQRLHQLVLGAGRRLRTDQAHLITRLRAASRDVGLAIDRRLELRQRATSPVEVLLLVPGHRMQRAERARKGLERVARRQASAFLEQGRQGRPRCQVFKYQQLARQVAGQ